MTRLRVLSLLVLPLIAAACARELPPAAEVFTTTSTVADSSTTTTTLPEEPQSGDDYSWRTGDCLDFSPSTADPPYAPYGDGPIVPCDGPHTHEVYLASAFDDGEDAGYPQAGDIVNEVCTGAFAEYVGAPRVDTVLEILFYFPDIDEWTQGERYQACLLFTPSRVPNEYGMLEESVAGRAASFSWQPDDRSCLDADLWSLRVGPEVDCDTEHLVQVLGEIELDGAGLPYPGESAVRLLATDQCGRLLPDPDARVVILSEPVIVQESEWAAGHHKVVCFAAVFDEDADLVPVVGSFYGDWMTVPQGPSA